MLPLFHENFILVEATSSHFFRVPTSTQKLLFRDRYFLRTPAVFSFFRTVTLSQELSFQNSFFFRAKILQSSHFSEQLFFSEELFRIKIAKKELLLHSINLFRKATFWKKLIFQKINFRIIYFFWRAVFLEQLILQKTLHSIVATSPEELLFYNTIFEKSYYFTATVPFQSYTSYLFVSN